MISYSHIRLFTALVREIALGSALVRFPFGRAFQWLAVGAATFTFPVLADEVSDEDRPLVQRVSQYSTQEMEELIVEGERIDPASMDFIEMEQIYRQKASAARNFKIGKYEEAFPELLQIAKLGFKDAQARVGFLFLHGLGGQQKSNLKALGWLGVASQGTTRPQYRNIFKQMMSEVPDDQQSLADLVVADYREKFDSKKLGIECWHSNVNHVRQFTCRYHDEMHKYYNHMSMTGTPFSSSGP